MNRRCNSASFGHAHNKHYGFYGGRLFSGGFKRPKYNVPVNISETENGYQVSVYATGFDKENIKLYVIDDTLFISGTRTVDESSLPNFIQQEFPIKSFEKRIELNGQVDTTAISAKQENAVLLVSLPKTMEAKQPAQDIKVS
jgi:HSP20 family protein